MPGHTRGGQKRLPDFYLRPTVNGRSIDPDVRVAFEQIWPWFWNYVDQELKDSDRAADLADEIAYRVSKFIEHHPGAVRSLVGLCRVAAVNFITTTKTREGRVDYRGLSQDVEATLDPNAPEWYDYVELAVYVDQVLQGHKPMIRKMLELRLLEKTWDEIGRVLDLTAGQARLRFRRALEGLRNDLICGKFRRGRS
jgi:DNA-directed RNA polymerase specialized sigma24 family protein